MITYIPHLYIGIGETAAMFTLRETYLHERWVGGADGYMHREVRSTHLQNLGQDPEECYNKALRMADEMGMELEANPGTMAEEMREIHRATAEQVEARRREREEREALWAREREANDAMCIYAAAAFGVMPVGKFCGQYFTQLDPSYLKWVAEHGEEFENPVMTAVAGVVAQEWAHLLPPDPTPGAYAGTVGKRQRFEAKVIRSTGFSRQSYSGYGREWVEVTSMVDDATGALLTVISTAFSAVVGDHLSFNAMVKEHGEYKGSSQTLLQRLTKVESLDY